MSDFLELDDDHLRELGRLNAKFCDLEHAVKRMIGFMLSSDPSLGAIVTVGAGFKQAVAVFDGLARYKIEDPRVDRSDPERGELRTALKLAVDQATRAAEKRNKFIHSVWFPEHYFDGERIKKDATRANVSLKLGRGFTRSAETLKTEDIAEVTAEIEGALQAIGGLWWLFGTKGVLEGWITT